MSHFLIQIIQIAILGIVQGAAELLPVSSSAHVIVAEKLMHMDPSSPQNTFLLVMLHTGTMFAVIVYFWNAWRQSYFSSMANFLDILKNVVIATILTAIIGLGLQVVIEKVILHGHGAEGKAEIEQLFSNLTLIAIALAAAGVLIIISGLRENAARTRESRLTLGAAALIGAVQGVCLPFRGFSRSGATISTGLLLGVKRRISEEFSFALAVVLTPPVIAKELLRLYKDHGHGRTGHAYHLHHIFAPGALGMVCAFLAGLLALKFLSRWLEAGRWHYFGFYCLIAAAAVFGLAMMGY